MNVHPLIVHFPIALLTVGAASEYIGFAFRKDLGSNLGYVLLLVGTVSIIAAAYTGDSNAETAADIAEIEESLEQHEDLGTAGTWIAVALSLFRTHLLFKKQFTGTARKFCLVLYLAVAVLVAASGYTGGHLVFHFGAGTRIAQPPAN